MNWKPWLSRSLVQLGLCFFAASTCLAQSIWTEGWQAAQIRTYVVTDTTEDGIVGDRGGWIVYDSAPDCNGAPHPNTAEILSVGGNKILKMNVVPNDCVSDLSVDLFSSPNIPISTNTVISFTQTGTLSNPQWNGFFPTLFPPPGDSIHISLLDQNKNAVVYIFQRSPQYSAHTTTLQVQFPDGHIGNVGYHEVFMGSHDATGGTYVRNLFQDFNQAPGFNSSGAVVSYVSFSVSGIGTATFDNLQIESRVTAAPEIVVEQPAGFVLANGSSSVDLGTGIVGGGVPRTFIIRNIGGADLTGVGITITGLHSNDFKLTTAPASQLPLLGGSTTFSVTFTPETIGERTALLRIANNDSDESPFDVMLKGTGVSPLQIAQQAYLKASNTGARDWFGFSVAASGDTVVVGARQEGSIAVGVNGNANDNSATNSGAAYVFVRNGTNWTQQAYLKASNTAANDLFGESVAISGDTVVVGARDEDSNATGVNGNQNDNSATGSGAAYVFVRSGTNWTQQTYLKASNAEAGDQFGRGVAISGDTIVVGAYLESSDATGVNGNQNNNNAPNSGAAYIFERSGTTWTQQAYLKASNTEAGDVFGHPVAISGDTVVIGAVLEDSNATGVNGNQADNSAFDSGAAYVFVRKGTVWSQQAYLKASNTEVDDRFGTSIGVSADTVVVGASWEDSKATGVNGIQSDNSASKSGAAYVFVRNGSSWSQQAYLKASNAQADDSFGQSVAISSDTIVVGAFTESSRATGINGNQTDNSAPLSGAAYVFLRNDTNWTQLVYLKASNTESADFFGFSAAATGNIVIIGAREEDSSSSGVNGGQLNNNADASGAGYVFDLRALTSIPDIAPAFTLQPQSRTVTAAADATFSVTVTGTQPITYQWQRKPVTLNIWTNLVNDGIYLGATSSSVTVRDTTTAMDGDEFRCVVTGPTGSTTSDVAVFTVQSVVTPPSVSIEPSEQTAAVGARVMFHAVASGTPPLRFQWRKNGSEIPGATSGDLVFEAVSPNDAAVYTVAVSNASGWVALASVTLRITVPATSGTVVAWGDNQSGQTNVPAGLSEVKAIAGGIVHSVALKSDGTVVAWGYNGQLQASVPVGLNGVTSIAAGGNSTAALKSDGTVVAWGSNSDGQTTVPSGLSSVAAVAVGGYHTVAVKRDGTAVAWGRKAEGQTTVPAGLSGVVAIAAGDRHTVILKSNGTVVAWGDNSSGQTNVPAGLNGVTAITAGAFFTVALKSDGTVAAWGNNFFGERTVPAGLTEVTAIAAGGYHTVALKNDGSVVAWGDNSSGQTTVPAGLSGVVAIAAGGSHTMALVDSGLAEAPRITAQLTGNNLIIRWPAAAAVYRVESTSNLSPPISWSNVTGTFGTNNGSISVGLPISIEKKFYHLVKP